MLTKLKDLRQRSKVDAGVLKIIAAVSMLLDHFAYEMGMCYEPDGALPAGLSVLYMVMRSIGRIAFPVFCFLLVEGFIHTKNRVKYAIRLLIFALISEVPYDLFIFGRAFDFGQQNVIWTLLIGFIMLCIMERTKGRKDGTFINVLTVLSAAFIVTLLRTDYEYYGIVVIAVMYLLYADYSKKFLSLAILFLMEPAAILSLIPIGLYNGEKGKQIKYFYYAFYPLHMLIIYILWRYVL